MSEGNHGGAADVVTVSTIDKGHQVFYLDSPYFFQSTQLSLQADGIRALPKEQAEIMVDLTSKQIVQAPDPSLRLHSLEQQGNALNLEFSFGEALEKQIGAPSPDTLYFSFADIVDEQGMHYEATRVFPPPGHGRIGYHVEGLIGQHFPKKLTFQLADYPNRLSTGFSLPLAKASQ